MPKNNTHKSSLALIVCVLALSSLDAAPKRGSRKRGRSPNPAPAAATTATASTRTDAPRVRGKVTIGDREVEFADMSPEEFLNAMHNAFSYKAQRTDAGSSSTDAGDTVAAAHEHQVPPVQEEEEAPIGSSLKPLGPVAGQPTTENITEHIAANRRDIETAVKTIMHDSGTIGATIGAAIPEAIHRATHDPIPEPVAMPAAGQTTVVGALGKQLGKEVVAEITAALHTTTHAKTLQPGETTSAIMPGEAIIASMREEFAGTNTPNDSTSDDGGRRTVTRSGDSNSADGAGAGTSGAPARPHNDLAREVPSTPGSFLVLPAACVARMDEAKLRSVRGYLNDTQYLIFHHIGASKLKPTDGKDYVLTPAFLISVFYDDRAKYSRENQSTNAACFLLIDSIMPPVEKEALGLIARVTKKISSTFWSALGDKPALWNLIKANDLVGVFDAVRNNDKQFYDDVNNHNLLEDLITEVNFGRSTQTMLNLVTALFATTARTYGAR